ncbi:MAG: NifU family protein [Acholeplasmataceae bacterium]|jgi:Fe-S cluster biogenesis protein NfuA|nr:NifU family protein [Acholeplasmataceae bacterium]
MTEQEKLVHELIDRIRPYLHRDGGDIEIVKIEEGIVYVKMLGACVGCPLIDVTLKDGIEKMLLENVPGIIAVITV